MLFSRSGTIGQFNSPANPLQANLLIENIGNEDTSDSLKNLLNSIVGKNCVTLVIIVNKANTPPYALAFINDEVALRHFLAFNRIPHKERIYVLKRLESQLSLLPPPPLSYGQYKLYSQYLDPARVSNSSQPAPAMSVQSAALPAYFSKTLSAGQSTTPSPPSYSRGNNHFFIPQWKLMPLFIGQINFDSSDADVINLLELLGGTGCVQSFRRCTRGTAVAEISNDLSFLQILDANGKESVSYAIKGHEDQGKKYYVHFEPQRNQSKRITEPDQPASAASYSPWGR